MRSDALPDAEIKKKKEYLLRWILVFFQLILGGIALFWVITKGNVSLDQFLACFTSSSIFPLFLSILCFAGAMGMVALRNSILICQKIPFGYYWGLALFLNALLTFIPWRVGEIGFPWLMRRDQQVSVKESVIVLLIVRAFDLLVIIAVILLWGNRYLTGIQLNNETWELAILIGSCVILISLFLILLFHSRLRKIANELFSKVKPFIDLRILTFILVISIFFFILCTFQSKLAFQAFGVFISLPDLMVLYAITLLTALLPVHPPGGWGTMDSIQVFLFVQLGFQVEEVASPILAVHTFYTFLILFGGIFGWLIVNRKVRVY